MPRRCFLALLIAPFARGEDDLYTAWERFRVGAVDWAEVMNQSKPGGLNAHAVEHFEPLDSQWRRVKSAFWRWVRG